MCVSKKQERLFKAEYLCLQSKSTPLISSVLLVVVVVVVVVVVCVNPNIFMGGQKAKTKQQVMCLGEICSNLIDLWKQKQKLFSYLPLVRT